MVLVFLLLILVESSIRDVRGKHLIFMIMPDLLGKFL